MHQAPLAMALFVGQDMVVAACNQHVVELWHSTFDAAIGTPLHQLLPELNGQGFDELYLHVVESQQPYQATEALARLKRGDEVVDSYYNFIFSPYHNAQGQLIGVLDVATEVTDQVLARRALEAREQKLQTFNESLELLVTQRTEQLEVAKQLVEEQHAELMRTFQQAPIAIFVVKGDDFVYELMNPRLWRNH